MKEKTDLLQKRETKNKKHLQKNIFLQKVQGFCWDITLQNTNDWGFFQWKLQRSLSCLKAPNRSKPYDDRQFHYDKRSNNQDSHNTKYDEKQNKRLKTPQNSYYIQAFWSGRVSWDSLSGQILTGFLVFIYWSQDFFKIIKGANSSI